MLHTEDQKKLSPLDATLFNSIFLKPPKKRLCDGVKDLLKPSKKIDHTPVTFVSLALWEKILR